MDFKHKPVLLDKCIEYLNIKRDGIYIDGTIGGAGHSVEILKRLGENGFLIGIDRDENAVSVSRARLESVGSKAKFTIYHMNFENIRQILNVQKINFVDGILLDLGVSSYQFDVGGRGFSYRFDAPLDMRMDTQSPVTAKVIVNQWDKDKLTQILWKYGEERWAARIASFIVMQREKRPIETTGQLADIVKKALPAKVKRKGQHPARKTFQAIRIAVNDELGSLKRALEDMVPILRKGGRICIITFHSLEDRIVKQTFKRFADPCVCPPNFPECICGKKAQLKVITPKPLKASEKELDENLRARSAKLRVAEKI